MAEKVTGSAYDPMQVEEPLDDKEATASDDDSEPEEADEPRSLQCGRKCVRNPSSWKENMSKREIYSKCTSGYY